MIRRLRDSIAARREKRDREKREYEGEVLLQRMRRFTIESWKRSSEASAAIRGDRFCRACSSCGQITDRRRAVANPCGHLHCQKCAEDNDACLKCKAPAEFIRIIEPEDDFSRHCSICFAESPNVRAAFQCGHVTCRACAVTIELNALEKGEEMVCPFCRAESPKGCIWLVEKRIRLHPRDTRGDRLQTRYEFLQDCHERINRLELNRVRALLQ